MAAADFNSIEQIKAQGIGEAVQKLKNNELYGTRRIMMASIKTAAAGFGVNSIGDRLFIGYLPRFSRVLGVRVQHDAMGAGATMSVGTDATTYATTQKDYGQGTGAELVSALDVSGAITAPVEAINVASTFDATGVPVTTANDEVRVATGFAFENQNGAVALYATTAGATYATGKVLIIMVEFVAQNV